MARYNRKNRAIVSGIFVGLASIYAIASQFDLEMSELNTFLIGTLLLFAIIIGMAACTLLVIKGIGLLFRKDAQAGKDSKTSDQHSADKPQ